MAALFHPRIEAWFSQRFGTPTEPQERGWPAIATGADTLIAAPTGSGKTLAAFLTAIDALVRHPDAATSVIYVSPLKALANDVQKNLEQPLAELGLAAEIRVGVRSGDTLPSERAAMQRRPPQILVTTPESLYILLTSVSGRKMLATAGTVIVDEIHALAGNKRGSHLALSLERLDDLCGHPLQRIGLSATVKPIATIASFLAGARPEPQIIVVGDRRHLDVAVETPASELGPIATNEQWEERYQRLTELADSHRSILVFVSTRKMAERVAYRMRERLGEDVVAAHHGSLSRPIRLLAEERFKNGKLRMMVATASLELGLDIGTVDLVCQIGSTRQLAAAWQRVGRAGHWRGAIPKGRFFALTRDDLIECAALVRGLRTQALDAITIPPWPRDILAQQIVATVAACADPDGWSEDALFALVRRAWPYRDLPREEFDALLVLLSDGISSRRGRRGAFLHRDGVHNRLRPRRGARLAAITSGGAIAETATYAVQLEPDNVTIGSLDEDFAIESNAGDIILLGTHSWKVRGVETGRVRVEDAGGAPPTVPFWLGEAPGRTPELSALVGDLRADIAALPPGEQSWRWLETECGLGATAAQQAIAYVHSSRDVLGGVPTTRHLIAERFFDDGGGMQLIIHAPFGAAINKAWGMALRKRFCRGFDFELQASASDNGLALALSEQHSFPLETIFSYLNSAGVRDILEQAVLQAPIFQTRWRWTVGRALALLRFVSGRRLAPQLQRMRSEDLLAAAFPMQVGCQDNHGGEDLEIPNHPYVQETMRDCLHEFLDLDGLCAVLQGLESGAITIAAIDTPSPSGLAAEILNVGPYGFLDDAPLEERRSRAVDLRTHAPTALPPGELDADAVAAVRSEAWPELRSADELHDLLLSVVWVPDAAMPAEWRPLLDQLRTAARVLDHRGGWVAAERWGIVTAAPPPAALAGDVWPGVEFPGAALAPEEEAATRIVGGWMEILGPTSLDDLARRLQMPPATVESALLALEGQGRVVRGIFGWCERSLLARIHRRMVRRLRAEIEPVSPGIFHRFLSRWQHTEPATRLHGLSGLQAVLEQLQGFEAAASAWESSLLPARVANYEPALLDELCLSGEFGWARITPTSGARVTPSRNSPITFFRRADMAWLLPAAGWLPDGDGRALSAEAEYVLQVLARRGASFFSELCGAGVVKSQVEDGLWELVAAGRATADGFDNLRAFLDPKRRAGQGHGSQSRPRHSAGRWALLRIENADVAAGSRGEADLARADLAERQARLWLRRYGVIFKALLARESSALPWYDVLLACRRLEARGEIRGGRFVSGFAGEQYALPHAVEALRAVRRLGATPFASEALAASDPLRLEGVLLPAAENWIKA
ncbi:MAG TPA: DEAD/DEAH box helicase [Terriglobales bacterium]|nr:DEAD/DEAH box helicase [Terriglobales bacterium]